MGNQHDLFTSLHSVSSSAKGKKGQMVPLRAVPIIFCHLSCFFFSLKRAKLDLVASYDPNKTLRMRMSKLLFSVVLPKESASLSLVFSYPAKKELFFH